MHTKSLYTLFLLLATLLATSCVYDKDPAPTATDGKMLVTFTLVTGGEGTTRSTRAGDTWGDNESTTNPTPDHGNEYENRIDPGKLQVLVYSPNDNMLIGKVEQLSYVQDDNDKYIYHFTGKLPLDSWNMTNGRFNGKIVVLANSAPYNPNPSASLSDLSQQTFDYTPVTDENATPSTAIPMWGVKTVDTQLTPNVAKNIGDIYILRAMAKIKVACKEGIKLENVQLQNYNGNGYVAPDNLASVSNTEALLTEGASFHPNTTNMQISSIPFTKAEDNSYYIYVPEYDNNKQTPAVIKVGARNNDEQTTENFTIELKEYNDGMPVGKAFNLIRNYVYTYYIRSVGKVNLDLQYKVVPWDENHGGDIEFD